MLTKKDAKQVRNGAAAAYAAGAASGFARMVEHTAELRTLLEEADLSGQSWRGALDLWQQHLAHVAGQLRARADEMLDAEGLS